jgi:NAD-dependent SIR2 family protein deacetylase
MTTTTHSPSNDLQKNIDTIARWIASSKHVVGFTGAGISTDSGIPDFRGPDGVWTRRDAGLPPPKWGTAPSKVRPNAAHYGLVELQDIGRLKFLISQNTDNLHLTSGIKLENIAELHGNGKLMRCLSCEKRYTREAIGWDLEQWGHGYRTQKPIKGQPSCPACGGRIISSVVNFGDPLPARELAEAARHAKKCDLMLVLGSSLVVNPAASLVGVALASGAKVVLINKGETPYDDVATLRIWDGIGEVFPPAVEKAKSLIQAS